SRRAAWSVSPLALARRSRSVQIRSGKRTERGVVPPASSTRRGRPRPTWTTRPSLAMRPAYGLRFKRTVRKSTSGISRSERCEGSRCARLFAFFIPPPLVSRGAPRADQAQRVLLPFHEDDQQDALRHRLADDARVLRVGGILDDESQRI